MTIEFIKEVLNNKITSLNIARISAINSGDLESISRIDTEIVETQLTLNKLSL